MGNVSADGKWLWLSGRYDDVVYAIDTTTGEVASIPVGKEPHGLDGVAAARPLLARPHRQHALTRIAAAPGHCRPTRRRCASRPSTAVRDGPACSAGSGYPRLIRSSPPM